MTLQKLGFTLFADHLLGFEVAGLLLLAAMVGAVAYERTCNESIPAPTWSWNGHGLTSSRIGAADPEPEPVRSQR